MTDELNLETAKALTDRLLELWKFLNKHGIDDAPIDDRSWLAPSRCCLVNRNGTASIEQSYVLLRELSQNLRTR